MQSINTCRICLEDDKLNNLINPCLCKGSIQYVHKTCLNSWISVTNNLCCSTCKFQYIYTSSAFIDFCNNAPFFLQISLLYVIENLGLYFISRICGRPQQLIPASTDRFMTLSLMLIGCFCTKRIYLIKYSGINYFFKTCFFDAVNLFKNYLICGQGIIFNNSKKIKNINK